MTDTEQLKVAVAVASLGRPGNLRALLECLAAQTQRPDQVILSMEQPGDCPDLSGLPFEVETIFGPRGMTVQRNRALDRLARDVDVVVFYDDDFVPSRLSLQGMARAFSAFDDVNAMTGVVLQDGIKGPGIPPAEAAQIVRDWDAGRTLKAPEILEDRIGCYGCNMAFRVAAIGPIRFDEKLRFYAWFEDLDFSARVPGRCVQTDAFSGVHCGEKSGREKNGRRLGYAQIVNPVYLWRKGSLPFGFILLNIVRNFANNHLRLLRQEPWVDRRGRAIGNWAGLLHVLVSRQP